MSGSRLKPHGKCGCGEQQATTVGSVPPGAVALAVVARVVALTGVAPGQSSSATSALASARIISTFAGDPGEGPATALGQEPTALVVRNRPEGPLVYVADRDVDVVRVVDMVTGRETVSGIATQLGAAGDIPRPPPKPLRPVSTSC